MRGNAEAHELIAPGSLGAVLELLAAEPGAVDADRGRHGADGCLRRGPARTRKSSSACGAFPICASSRSTPTALPSAQPPRFSICAGMRYIAAGVAAARQSRKLDRLHRQPEPRHAGRQSCERIAGRGLLAGAAGLRRGDRADFRARHAAAFPTPNSTPATSAMCSRPTNCSTRFICRGDSRGTGNICARWERGAPWPSPRLRWVQPRSSRMA